jgi:CheY-like chemotaxis protein
MEPERLHALSATPRLSDMTGSAAETLTAVSHFVWPLVAAVVIWRLLPAIRKVIESRGFSVKVGGTEITVQAASDQLHDQVADLQRKVTQLADSVPPPAKERGADIPGVGATPAEERLLARLLWVDDKPENNAYLMTTIRGLGVDVVTASSTQEGLGVFRQARPPFDAVVSDTVRVEDGAFRADAGVELISQLRTLDADVPVFVYASPAAVRAGGEEARVAGAAVVTASPTELLAALEHAGLPVGDG